MGFRKTNKMQAQKTLDGFLKASFPRARNPTRKRKDPPKKIKREQSQPVPSIALPVTFVAAHPPRPSFPVLPRTPVDFSSFCVVPSPLTTVETKDAVVPAEIMLQHQHRACLLKMVEEGDDFVQVDVELGAYMPGLRFTSLVQSFCERHKVKPPRQITSEMLAGTNIRKNYQQVCKLCHRRTTKLYRNVARDGVKMYCTCKKEGEKDRTKMLVFDNAVVYTRQNVSEPFLVVDFHFSDCEEPTSATTPVTTIAPVTLQQQTPTLPIPNVIALANRAQQSFFVSDLIAKHISCIEMRSILVLFPPDPQTRCPIVPTHPHHCIAAYSWSAAINEAYGHDRSIYSVDESTQVLDAGNEWMWEDKFDVIVVLQADMMNYVYYRFFKTLLTTHAATSCNVPSLWFCGEADYGVCTKEWNYTYTKSTNSISLDARPNPRYLLLAKELFQEFNTQKWEHCFASKLTQYKTVSAITKYHMTPLVSQLRPLFREEALPNMPPVHIPFPSSQEKLPLLALLYGCVLPRAYQLRHHTDLRAHFRSQPLRNQKTWSGEYRHNPD